jgi:tRNA 2-thiouridine synthesizing protein B
MLHIVNKSPWERRTLESLVRVARGGSLLLIEDGVYAALRDGSAADLLRTAQRHLAVYVLQPDAEARAVADQILDGVTPVDYHGFVDLVTKHARCQSWL